jgi:hypothetical protein
MAKPLLPLCEVPKIAMRDAWTGATAHIFLPFYQYGYWFASGQQYTFPSGSAAQDLTQAQALQGTSKPNTFIKAPQICINGS